MVSIIVYNYKNLKGVNVNKSTKVCKRSIIKLQEPTLYADAIFFHL